MFHRKLIVIAFLASLSLTGCKGKSEAVSDAEKKPFEEAVIRFFGDPALDGCGYVVDVNETIYMPKNLSSEYQKDKLEVLIKYEVLERVNCGLKKDAHLSMNIEEIKMK